MRRVVLRLPTCAFYPKSLLSSRSPSSRLPKLDPTTLANLIITTASLVIVILVLLSYLVYLLQRALRPQIYPV